MHLAAFTCRGLLVSLLHCPAPRGRQQGCEITHPHLAGSPGQGHLLPISGLVKWGDLQSPLTRERAGNHSLNSTMASHPHGSSGSALTVAQATAPGKTRMAGEAAGPSGFSPPALSWRGRAALQQTPAQTAWGRPQCLPPLTQTMVLSFADARNLDPDLQLPKKIRFDHDPSLHSLVSGFTHRCPHFTTVSGCCTGCCANAACASTVQSAFRQ